MKETMTSEERVEAFKRELGLILRQILGLDTLGFGSDQLAESPSPQSENAPDQGKQDER